MVDKGAFAVYSPVEILLRDLPRNLRAKSGMKLQIDLRVPLMFKYNTLSRHVIDPLVTTDALDLLDSEGACAVPGVSPYSIPVRVPLPQMLVVIIFLPINSV